MFTHDVVVWTIRNRNSPRKNKPKRTWTKPFELRWKVGSVAHSRTFLTHALADDFRADMLKAARRGELFETESGLPESMLEPQAQQKHWYDYAQEYVATRWPGAAAKTRETIVDSLATVTPALLDGEATDLEPRLVRAAMFWSLIPRSEDVKAPAELANALRRLSKGTKRMEDLLDPRVRDAVIDVLGKKLDGTPAAAATEARRRRALNTALEYAVEMRELTENPLKQVKRKKVARDTAVDRRVVINAGQARELLTAVSYVGSWRRARGRRLVAFYATLYYAGLRPAEAVGLREDDCDLPDEGWGLLTLQETRPKSGTQWTDSGMVHELRGLKQRDEGAVREVPIPPVLAAILREHIDDFGAAEDGRLFSNERGGVLGYTTFSRALEEARRFAFTPRQVASPLAGRPYDLRHAALSTWLNAGVDPTEVAERAGNSVEVLLKRYAKCLDGRQERNNKLIERALDLDDQARA